MDRKERARLTGSVDGELTPYKSTEESDVTPSMYQSTAKKGVQPPPVGESNTKNIKNAKNTKTSKNAKNIKNTKNTKNKGVHQERDLSNLRAFIHIFRVLTGPSTIGTPKIVQNGGLLVGPLGLLFMGFLNTACNITIVKGGRTLSERLGRPSMTYEEVVEESILLYPRTPHIVATAKTARSFASISLMMCQLGLLSVYIKIVGGTLQQELSGAFPSMSFSLLLAEFIVTLFLIPYSWINNLKLLSWCSFIGNFLVAMYSITILQWAVRNLQDPASLPLVTPKLWTLPIMLGAALFTVEGIPMMLPIENRAQNPEAVGGPCGLIALACTLNICLNTAVGFYGYLALGNSVRGNILLQLPRDGIYTAVNIAVASMVFVSFTVQLYQPAEATSLFIKSQWPESSVVQTYGNIMARTGIVVVAFTICGVVPRVDLLMALVGACATAVLVFFFPPLVDLLIECQGKERLPKWILLKTGFLFLFGLLIFVVGTYTSLEEIIRAILS